VDDETVKKLVCMIYVDAFLSFFCGGCTVQHLFV